MRKNTKYKLTIGLLAILALIASIYARLIPRPLGEQYLTLHLQSFNSHSLLLVMQWVSLIFTGWPSALVVIAIGTFVWWRIGRLEAILVPVGGLLTLLNTALKLAINRARPSADLVHVLSHEQGSGFPSGHAFFAIAILGLLAYFIFTNLRNHTLRIAILFILIAIILLVGTSRVYLGVHWTSDVIGGYLFGGLLLTVLIWFYRVWKAHH